MQNKEGPHSNPVGPKTIWAPIVRVSTRLLKRLGLVSQYPGGQKQNALDQRQNR